MNNKVYRPNNVDPNKIKKCSCEDKYGPKPFNASTPNNNINSNSTKSN